MKKLLILFVCIASQYGVNAQTNSGLLISKDNITVCPGQTITILTDAPAAGFGQEMLCPSGNGFAFYPFCGNANNETGNGFHGRVEGATSCFNRYGRNHSAYAFDGLNNCISMPGFPIAGSFNFSAWIITSDKRDQVILSKSINDPGFAGFQLKLNYDTILNKSFPAFYAQGNTGAPWGVSANQDVSDGQWHKIAVHYTQGDFQLYSNIDIYIDGIWVAHTEGYFPPIEIENNYPLFVGAQYDINYALKDFFNGSIDDISFNLIEDSIPEPYTYHWSNGATTASIDVSTLVDTMYIVTVAGINGSSSDTLFVSVNQQGVLPLMPDTIFGTSVQCLPIVPGAGSFSVSPQPGQSYRWTLPGAMKIDMGQNTSTINVSWTNLAGQAGISGDICVISKNNCGQSIPYCKKVDLQLKTPKTPSLGSGFKICPNDGLLPLLVSMDKNALSYNWIMPPGLTIRSGQDTRIITLSADNGFTGGVVTVTASNVCGKSPVGTRLINTDLPVKPLIGGPLSNFCVNVIGGYANYTIRNKNQYSLATHFEWSGLSQGSFQLANASIITSVVNIAAPFQLIAIAKNGCGQSETFLNVDPAPLRPGMITGPIKICPGTINVVYSITSNPIGLAPFYEWELPANTNIVSGQGTKSIVADFPMSITGNKYIRVREINSCNLISPWRSMLVNFSALNCRLANESANEGNLLTVYPNPAIDNLHLNMVSTSDQKVKVNLYDVVGKLILSTERENFTGENNMDLALNNVISGIYYIEVMGKDIHQRVKIQKVD